MHDPIDRRVVMCHLTDEGRELIDHFGRMQRLQLEAVADILTSAELAQVAEVMELLAVALERHAGEQDRALGSGALAAHA